MISVPALFLRSNLDRVATGIDKVITLASLLVLAGTLCSADSVPTSGSAPKSVNPTVHKTASKGKKSRKKKGNWKTRGQQKIDTERTRQIQGALVREHYLTSEPSGTWDVATQDAMRRYQADQGWQDKSIPDSRALIKLGLGPGHEHLLNPESAMTSEPVGMRNPSAPLPVVPASTPAIPVSSAPIPAPSSENPPPK